ncbi:MAG: hypothetical protein KAR38_13675 [Calditrichia bacterium]|nr:hypothetical protein [Calditrichia bacterium]
MKLKLLYLILPFLIMLQGCLVVKAFKFQVEFNEKYNLGNITITSEDVRSQISMYKFNKDNPGAAYTDEQIKKTTGADFEGLLKYCYEDDFLLDMIKCGIYIKNRRLYEKDNILCGEYSGIFKNLTFDDEGELIVRDTVIVLTLDADDDVIKIETDGVLYEDEKQVIITWPKQKNIYWKLIYLESFGENTYSMIDEFREWEKSR